MLLAWYIGFMLLTLIFTWITGEETQKVLGLLYVGLIGYLVLKIYDFFHYRKQRNLLKNETEQGR